MTAIFISHSSADNDAAARMKAWLEAQGHTSLFLDFDPGAGIQAGANWEQTLYRQLRQCQAVIALLSPGWLASRWCFAELVQARERGKPVFFVKVEPVDSGGLFSDVQHIDLTQRADEGHERLRLGLLERGLDPLDAFDWDPHRPPYPGLLAFDEADAAIFFGRAEALAKTLEALDALRRESGEAPRFVLLLGASGSGKSSLARAGVIPRLKKRPVEWLPIPPLRPQLEPLDELALVLAAAFEAHGRPRDWRSLRDTLMQAADATPTDGAALLGLARDLALAARQTDTTVLLTIDQAEELFGYTPKPAAERFLRLLRAALESGDRRLMAMATLRSEFLAEFQNQPTLQDKQYGHHVRYRALTVDPMPQASVAEIIRGPALLAGLQLDPGLIDAIVGDMGTQDALPLLAFTLRRIYERTGADGRLTLAAYEAVGRLDGAVRQEAERVVREAQPGAEDLEALHAAFVPTLVRITAEGGYVRRRALVEQLPQRVLGLLRRFIDARLLVSDRDAQGRETHEVAHEALLRTWPQLSDWLIEDKDNLRLLEGLHSAALEWQQAERREDLQVHRDGRLRDLDTLFASPRFKLPEASVEQHYLDACRAAQQAREAAERAEQERKLRDAERIAEEQTRAAHAERRRATTALRFSVVAGLLFVVALGGAVVAWQQYREALAAKERVGEVQQLTRQTGDIDSRPQLSLLLAVRAAALGKDDAVGTLTAIDGLRQQLLSIGGQPLAQPDKVVTTAAFSPDRRWLATGDESGAVRLWNLGAAEPTARAQRLDGHTARVGGMAFSRDGRWLVTGGGDGSVRLWRVDGTEAKASSVFALGTPGAVHALSISRDGQWLAFGTQAGHLCLWRMAAEGPVQAPCKRGKSNDPVMQVLFSPGGRWLATTCTGGCPDGPRAPVRLWDLSAAAADAEPRELVPQRPQNDDDSLLAVAFNGDDTRLAVAYGYFVELWDLTLPNPPNPLEPPVGPFASGGGYVTAVALSADQRWLAVADGSSADVRLWDLRGSASAAPLLLKGHSAAVGSLGFSDEGRWLASGAVDASARLWDLSTPTVPSKLLRGHDHGVVRTAFVPGEQPGHLVSWSGDANARLWTIPDVLADPLVLRSPNADAPLITAMALGAGGKEVATSALNENVLRLWSLADGRKPTRELPLPSWSHAIAISPDGRWLAAKSHTKGVISLWNLKIPSEPLLLVEGAHGEGRTLQFSPDSRWLASGTWVDGASSLNLWDVSGERPSLEPRHRCAVGAPLRELTFTADGQGLAAGAHGGPVRIWNLASPTPCADPRVLPHDNVVYQVAFSPDGRWAATASNDQKGRVWDLQGAAPKLAREVAFSARVLQAAFSPDGRWVAFGSWNKTAALLALQDVATATPVFLSGHVGRLSAMAFSPNSLWLATASEDRSIRLWSPAAPTATPVVLRGHDASVQHLAFTPDNRWLVSGAFDGTVRKWRLRRDDLIEVACRTAGRDLTTKEAAQFLSANVKKEQCGGH